MKCEIYQVAMELDNGLVLKNYDYHHKRYNLHLKNGDVLKSKTITGFTSTYIEVLQRTKSKKYPLDNIVDIQKLAY